jgi:transposase
MQPRRVGMIPAKADPDKQREFMAQELQGRIEEAKAGQRVLLFTDAAHFVRGAYLGILWCFERLFVRGPSGRQRLNVLGALNAITHELTMVTNDTYINAETFCQLLRMIAKEYAGKTVTVVLDNARYQKCKLVYEVAASLHIELLYLPSYSPNLNLIERLWKFVKKKCLYSKFYDNFEDFKASILGCLNELQGKHRDEIRSLLTLKFQTFENRKPMAA